MIYPENKNRGQLLMSYRKGMAVSNWPLLFKGDNF